MKTPKLALFTVAALLAVTGAVDPCFGGNGKKREKEVEEWPQVDLEAYSLLYVENFRPSDPKAAQEAKRRSRLEAASSQMADDVAQTLDPGLFAEIERGPTRATAGAVGLRAEIMTYKPRVPVPGAGAAKLMVFVRLVDAATGRDLVGFPIRRTSARWGPVISGGRAFKGIDALSRDVAQDIAAYVERNKVGQENSTAAPAVAHSAATDHDAVPSPLIAEKSEDRFVPPVSEKREAAAVLLADTDSSSFQVIDAATGNSVLSRSTEGAAVQVLASPVGSWGAVLTRRQEAGGPGAAVLYLVRQEREWTVSRTELGVGAEVVITDSHGRRLVVVGHVDAPGGESSPETGARVEVIDPSTLKAVGAIGIPSSPLRMAVSESGKYLYLLTADIGASGVPVGNLEVTAVDLAEGRFAHSFSLPFGGGETPFFLPVKDDDKAWLLAPGEIRRPGQYKKLTTWIQEADPGEIWKLDPSARVDPARIPLPRILIPPVLAPDGRCVYTAGLNADGSEARLARVCSGDDGQTVPIDVFPCALALSPDGKRLVAGYGPSEVVGVMTFDSKDLSVVRRYEAPLKKIDRFRATPHASLVNLEVSNSYAASFGPGRVQPNARRLTAFPIGDSWGGGRDIALGGVAKGFGKALASAYLQLGLQVTAFSAADIYYFVIPLPAAFQAGPRYVTFGPDGTTAFVFNDRTKAVMVVDAATGSVTSKTKTNAACSGIISFSSAKAGLLVCKDKVYSLDLATGSLASFGLTKREMGDVPGVTSRSGEIFVQAPKGIWLLSSSPVVHALQVHGDGNALFDLLVKPEP